MTESPRPKGPPGRTTKSQQNTSGPMLLFVAALDTTWRAFLPPIGGVFIGIWLDRLFHIAPVATITCLILGAVIGFLLIFKQLRDLQRAK